MNPAPSMDAICNDVRNHMERAVIILQYTRQGRGAFTDPVDVHARLGLALGQIESAMTLMRQHVLPRITWL